jgi:DNA-binding IclR family transcriptional regulator
MNIKKPAQSAVVGKVKGSTPKLVGGTVKTLQTLEYVVQKHGPVTAAEVARATRQNPSTCFNITRTLVQQGYLQPVPGTTLYILGPALHAMVRKVSEKPDMEDMARPLMQEVANRYEVMVTLWKRTADAGMTLLVVTQSDSAIRIQMTVGVKRPLLQGGMGRVMVTELNLSDTERRELFSAAPQHRPIAYSTFMAQARLARRRGWSIDDGNWHTSVTSVCVPVRVDKLPVELVCSASMFRQQHKDEALERLVGDLQEVAAKISRALQSSRPTLAAP